MYANFKVHYQKFRSFTQYPKFGWTGFGCHFESSDWLLIKPIELGLVSYEESTLTDFTSYWKKDASIFFAEKIPEIDFNVYFEKLCNEPVFDKMETLLSIKRYLLENL
jgi:hypothetical protein